MKTHIFRTKSSSFIFLVLFLIFATHSERTEAETVSWQYRGVLCALDNPNPKVLVEALRKLEDLYYAKEVPSGKAIDLAAFLKKEEPDVRLEVIKLLEAMGEAAANQNPEVVPWLVERIEDKDSKVRSAAAQALGAMKKASAEHVNEISKLLDESSKDVRLAAISALGALGSEAASQTTKLEQLTKIENEDDEEIRSAATNALSIINIFATVPVDDSPDENGSERRNSGVSPAQQAFEIAKSLSSQDTETVLNALYELSALGTDAAGQVLKIAEKLNSSENRVQYAALLALGSMGDAADGQVSKIVELLKKGDIGIRKTAADVLGNMKRQAPRIAKLLKDENDEVVEYALIALKNMGKAAAAQAPEIASLLSSPNIELRTKAVEALEAMQEVAAEYACRIAMLLDHNNRLLRLSSIMALKAMGEEAAEQCPLSEMKELGAEQSFIQKIENLLTHKDWETRSKALMALGAMGVSTPELIHVIAGKLTDYDEDVRNTAVEVLESKGRLEDKRDILLILSGQYKIPQVADTLTFYAYYFAGGQPDLTTLIEWVTSEPRQSHGSMQGQEMGIFLDAMTTEKIHKEVREKLANCISHLVRTVKWKESDKKSLQSAELQLRAAHFPDQADVIKNKIEKNKWKQRLEKFEIISPIIIGAHVLFWIGLIWFYPKSSWVQSMIFWDRWTRKIVGLFYVDIILKRVPPIRTILFAPFKDALISSAALDTFDEKNYFDQSKVRDEGSGRIRSLKEAITEIKNQIYLEGESGLGKTMFLRYLIRHSRRTVIYLRADNCSKGVIEAIQTKLHGPAKDPAFLKDLIHSAAIDICIDGLNEVSPDTKAHITEFLQSYPKSNIIIASQPLEWMPPSTLDTFILQPLDEEQIEVFLLTRQQGLPPDASVSGKDFEQACMKYLHDILNDAQPMERIDSAKRVLSNPIDLTLVAQMLASGQYPDLFHLLEQQYDLMNNDYKRLYRADFPLTAFSEMVFQMRLDDKIALTQKEYLNEIKSMEKHKMVLSRSSLDAQEKIATKWYFRHDKIMDYFITCTFLGTNNIRQVKYFNDPRFRGVYFLLAMLLPWDEAEALREHLIQYSATTKDHTVSDTFVQLLISRKAA